MIKMGKIEVNNKIPLKVFLFCILFSFGLFLIFGGYLISEFIKTKDYIKISSTVKNVGHYQVRNSDDFSTYYYADLVYDYNGKSYEYRKTLHMFLFYPKVNSKVTIYIDPNSPTLVRNTWVTSLGVIIIIFLLIFHFGMIKAYLVRKKQLNEI